MRRALVQSFLRRSFKMTSPLVDVHCHLHDERLWSASSPSSRRTFEGVLFRARNAGLSHVVSCATHERDWRVLERLVEQQGRDNSPKTVIAFGVHPWWSQELSPMTPESLEPLKKTLMRHPTASVGEIGLCKSARGRHVPEHVQLEAFRGQLEVAAELERACVLHCVGYYGKLLEILLGVNRSGGRLPPVLVFHSFSSSPDPRMKKAAACCKELPLEVLLLETDAPDQAPSREDAAKVFEGQEGDSLPLLLREDTAGINEPAMVTLALQSAAEIRGAVVDELAAAVYQNFRVAFGLDNRKIE